MRNVSIVLHVVADAEAYLVIKTNQIYGEKAHRSSCGSQSRIP